MVKTNILVPSRINGKNNSEYHKLYYTLNRDKMIKRSLENQANNVERVREKNRKWRKTNPERNEQLKRASFLRTRWGITIEQYNAMLKRQSGVCAICGNVQKPYFSC